MAERRQSPEAGLILRTGFGFKTIWVLESLPNGEYRTGKALYENVLLPMHSKDPGLLVEFLDVPNRIALLDALETIRSTLESTGDVPLVHMETHGNQEGVGLKSGECVRYEEICPTLRRINILGRNNLFIVVAACHGVHLSFILRDLLAEPCPFWGVCGPSEEISAGDIIDGYSAFYGEALASADMNAALSKLKQAIPRHADKFNIWNSEYLFLLAFRHYLHHCCNADAVKQRAKAIIDEAQAGLRNTLDTTECANYVRKRLGTEAGQAQEFERMKRRFFMHDLYPQDSSLPSPSFEDMRTVKLIGEGVNQ